MTPTHFKEGIPDNIKELYFDSFNSDKVTVLNFLGETVYIVSNRVDFDTVREFFGHDIQDIRIELRSKEREIESLKEHVRSAESEVDRYKSWHDSLQKKLEKIESLWFYKLYKLFTKPFL